MAKHSTYARLLKPGQKWYTKDDYITYTTVKVEILRRNDTSTVKLGDKLAGPLGQICLVRVTVEGRHNPITLDGNDRVQLTDWN